MSEAKDADVDRLTLLPCPFCGAAAKLKSKPRLAIPNMTYWVGCKTPNCPGDQVWEKIRAEAAVEAWNSRQSLSQEAVRDDALEEAARVCDKHADDWLPHHIPEKGTSKNPIYWQQRHEAAKRCSELIRAIKRTECGSAGCSRPRPSRR